MSQAGKGHVPEENLPRYRALAQIARQYNTLGNNLSNMSRVLDAQEAWRNSKIIWREANALRVDIGN